MTSLMAENALAECESLAGRKRIHGSMRRSQNAINENIGKKEDNRSSPPWCSKNENLQFFLRPEDRRDPVWYHRGRYKLRLKGLSSA